MFQSQLSDFLRHLKLLKLFSDHYNTDREPMHTIIFFVLDNVIGLRYSECLVQSVISHTRTHTLTLRFQAFPGDLKQNLVVTIPNLSLAKLKGSYFLKMPEPAFL